MVRPEVDGIGAELDCPFNVVAAGFLVLEDITEWVLSDYRYVVGIKVVTKLLGYDQAGVQQLLDLGIASLRLIDDLIDEVDWALDFVCVSGLFSFNNNGGADYPVGRYDVD